MTTTLLVGSSPDALATELVKRLGAIAKESVLARGVFNVAVSGGSMPKILSGLAQAEGIDWSKTRIFFADERCVPLDHSDSNYKAWEGLFSSSGIPAENVVAVRTDLTPKEAAADYEAKLRQHFPPPEGDSSAGGAAEILPTASPPPSFDAALLGVGPDGHTCSLFPSHPLLEERSKWVAHIEDSPKPPRQRVTLTYPVLNNSRNAMFIGTGEGKASLLPQLLSVGTDGALESAGESSPYPAARVKVAEGRALAWCVDEAAASQCPPEIAALATKC
ncbi:conserved unknown protein [Ectocarpus siliculosus]|uniref:6-phosphogluconolactonase n=1 Tax=Ectocarpus siliculosus TaxID=2880 RepID=D8LJ68_ECTSI|nr:conserved unknown protein [Ectocarpus siliculosus]|eukprot:CBN76952.1 conserved unknown protein [Ectocarpus siliculosus]